MVQDSLQLIQAQKDQTVLIGTGSRRQTGYQEEPSRKAGLWIPLYSAALPRSSTRGQENRESGVRGQSELSRGDPVFIKTKATNKILELRSPGVLSVVE